MVDNMFGGISQFCYQAGVETKKEKTSNNFLKPPLHIRKTVLLLEEEEELQSVVFGHKDRDLKSNNKEK